MCVCVYAHWMPELEQFPWIRNRGEERIRERELREKREIDAGRESSRLREAMAIERRSGGRPKVAEEAAMAVTLEFDGSG